jgi:hypothetical protein
MPDAQPMPSRDCEADEVNRDILYALTEPDENRPLWTIDELARELGDPCIIDHINELGRAGLIHRTADGYVFASRSAVRHIQMVGRVV